MAQDTLVKPGTKVNLAGVDPDYHDQYVKDSPEVQARLSEDLATIAALQERLYAGGEQGLLIVLQAMDAAGKDGTIRHVMGALNAQSCCVASFKAPTPLELSHDFLWRIHEYAPGKGRIAIFNRSHYEDVLVVRVHKLVPEKVWRKRYDHIRCFEELLADGGTRIVKIFLHISKEEQERRFEERAADPTKQWKLSASDVPEHALWDQYMAAYEEALSRTSTARAPWYVIPSNHKWYRNLAVAEIVAATMKDMHPQWPKPQVDVSQLGLSAKANGKGAKKNGKKNGKGE